MTLSVQSGGCYAGENYESASSALCHDRAGRTWRTGDADHTSYLPKTDQKKHRAEIKPQREMDESLENKTSC